MNNVHVTTRSRKIHPFDDDDDQVAAAQVWEYPERERKKGKKEHMKQQMRDSLLWHSLKKQTESKNAAAKTGRNKT